MKSKAVSSLIVGALACFLGANAVHAVPPSGLQLMQISLAGSLATTKSISSNVDVVVKKTLTTANIINLALGYNPTNAVPANQVLVLAFVFADSGAPECALIVYDTTTHSNLVTIATLDVGGAVDSVKGAGSVGAAGQLETAGAFTGGWIALMGKAKFDNTGLTQKFISFSATATGIIRGNDGDDFEVALTKGSCKMLGTLPNP